MSNYLLFENSLNDPKLASVVRLSEELKHINLETMQTVDREADGFVSEDDEEFAAENGDDGEDGEGSEDGETDSESGSDDNGSDDDSGDETATATEETKSLESKPAVRQ